MPLKQILFIVPYPPGSAPSQRFRFEQYFNILKEHDYKIVVASFWSEKGWAALYKKGQTTVKLLAFLQGFIKRVILLFKINSYQFIFLHREAFPLGPPVFEFLISKAWKKKIIYDFDDAIWLPNASDQNRFVSHLKYHQKVKFICKWSWKVSCGNDFLANYAKQYNKQVFLNPTTIDTSYHKSTKNRPGQHEITIGWTGSHSTTKYLRPLAPVLQELKAKFHLNIMIISDLAPDWEFNDYEFVIWDKAHEIEQLNRIDIGIMPLEDSLWEQGKCGFKALQYMALEKPAVVSDVGVNNIIIDHGENGYLCTTTADWIEHLTELIISDSKRTIIGSNGRKKVQHHYSVESNTDLFLSLFE